ncbi:hypothetical protein BHE90_010610 [Fusarium euwallaceae]|uniref:JmjC domain-containing protein n=1 Tax=Fusarium euwallaceae TaxID=1147111 RepID=A0A430LGS4_9HYPO|nr:hypothetical protein BHE90_010610 [Fusarium euwallaceae]
MDHPSLMSTAQKGAEALHPSPQTRGGALDIEMVDGTTPRSDNPVAHTSGAKHITNGPLAIYHARIDKLEAEMTKRLNDLKEENCQLTDKWMNEVRVAELNDEADTTNDETGSVNDAQGQVRTSRSPAVPGEQRPQRRRGSSISASKVKVMIREFEGRQGSIDSLSRYFVAEVASLRKASAAPAFGAPRLSSTAAAGRNSQLLPDSQLPSDDKPLRRPEADTRDPPASQPQTATPGDNQKTFTLTLNEMGKNLTENLQRFAQDEAFTGIININDPAGILDVSWEGLIDKLQQRQARETDTTEVRYRYGRGDEEGSDVFDDAGEGWCNLFINKNMSTLKMPKYPQDVQRPSPAQASKFLDDLVDKLPDKPCTYYVGGSIDSQLANLVDSGNQLADYNKTLPGISSVYCHLGDASSGTALHHEDAAFWSCNLTLVGFKLWILIDEKDNDKLHKFLKWHWVQPPKESTSQLCDQWARHLCLVFGPKRLTKEQIGHSVLVTGPKQMIVTRPGQYHLVINYCSSFAISTNFLLPDEPLFPETISTCRDCGLYRLEDPANHLVDAGGAEANKASRTQTTPKPTAKKPPAKPRGAKIHGNKIQGTSRAMTRSQGGIRSVVKELKRHDPKVRIAAKDAAADLNTFRLANIIRTRLAVKQFVSLVEQWRHQGEPQQSMPEGEETQFQVLTRRLQTIDRATQSAHLGQLQVRAGEFYLAWELAKHRETEGRERSSSALCEDIYTSLGWKKSRFETHRDHGNKWLALCDKGIVPRSYRPGLICYIFFGKRFNKFKVSHTDYLEPKPNKKVDTKSFARMLRGSYINAICKAGEAFLGALEGSREVKFQFEDETNTDWDNIDEDEVKRLLCQVGEKDEDGDMSDVSDLTDLTDFDPNQFPEGEGDDEFDEYNEEDEDDEDDEDDDESMYDPDE